MLIVERDILNFKTVAIRARRRAKSKGVPVTIRPYWDFHRRPRWEIVWDDGRTARTDAEFEEDEHEETTAELEREADETQAFVDSFDRSDNYTGVVSGGDAGYDSDEYYSVDTVVSSGDEKDLV